MKNLSCLILVGSVLLSASARADLQFSVAIPEVHPQSMNLYSPDNNDLNDALTIHNLLYQMNEFQEKLKSQKQTEKNLKLQQKRMKAMKQCNLRRLSEEFKNPEEVWKKMTEAYDQKEKELTLYINAAEPPSNDDLSKRANRIKADMDKGLSIEKISENQTSADNTDMSDEQISEAMAFWKIGNDILLDLYANQDKWGERKSATTPSFPLWDDQKYQFDKEWGETYQAINAHFGVPLDARPDIGDEKYDYAQAQKLQEAHRLYIAELSMKNPDKAKSLSESLRTAPSAPKPLPPKEETVFFLESDNPSKQVYPELPDVWKKYAADNFSDVNPKGEMAAYFSDGLTLKESSKHLTPSQQNNRLAVYQLLKKELNGAQRASDLLRDHTQKVAESLQEEVSDYTVSENGVDLTDSESFQQAVEELRELLALLIENAEEKVAQDQIIYQEAFAQTDEQKRLMQSGVMTDLQKENPDYHAQMQASLNASAPQDDQILLDALKKDMDGRIFLTETNAKDIDRLLKEYEAAQALDKEKVEWEKRAEENSSQETDHLCLNGGI